MAGLLVCSLAYLFFAENFSLLESCVVVSRLDVEIPSDKDQAGEFLWNTFSEKPELKKFEQEPGDHWVTRFHRHTWFLQMKARCKLLDANSLKNCLDGVFNDTQKKSNAGLAYLPVGAYAAKQGGKNVWIVVVKWEWVGEIDDKEPFGHIRMFAFNASNGELMGYATCM